MTRDQAVQTESRGCVGSLQWGIDTGRAFDVDGIWQYGRMVTDVDSHTHALEYVLAWDCLWNDEAFTFIAPKVIKVWQIGPKYTYMRTDGKAFMVRNGRAEETSNISIDK